MVQPGRRRIVGLSRRTGIGKNRCDLFPPQQADLFADSDRQALAAAETLDIPESVVATAQGELRCLYVRKTALRDAAAMPRICSALPSTSPSGNKPKKRCGSPQSRSRPTRRS
uniref:PAS domain-containing protein n=1 Tax=Methylomonas koyamae TaxID=702114 RepID=UPI003570D09B